MTVACVDTTVILTSYYELGTLSALFRSPFIRKYARVAEVLTYKHQA